MAEQKKTDPSKKKQLTDKELEELLHKSEQKTDFVKQNPTIIEESTLAEKPLVDTYISFQFLKKIFYLYIKQIFNGKH